MRTIFPHTSVLSKRPQLPYGHNKLSFHEKQPYSSSSPPHLICILHFGRRSLHLAMVPVRLSAWAVRRPHPPPPSSPSFFHNPPFPLCAGFAWASCGRCCAAVRTVSLERGDCSMVCQPHLVSSCPSTPYITHIPQSHLLQLFMLVPCVVSTSYATDSGDCQFQPEVSLTRAWFDHVPHMFGAAPACKLWHVHFKSVIIGIC